ncbi:hypothetical protein CAPN006_12370 [Capnocytophaga canimorsus]|nr:hypothetical protein CAPN006_12370 [Capnocytophaga canimorsus]
MERRLSRGNKKKFEIKNEKIILKPSMTKPKEKPKPMPKEEPDILEIYYTDEKGNRIDKEDLQPNTVVYLVIKGQNLAGKTGDLELSNAKVDFEHQGVYLENDILENYVLESDYNKIELKVIKPKND